MQPTRASIQKPPGEFTIFWHPANVVDSAENPPNATIRLVPIHQQRISGRGPSRSIAQQRKGGGRE